MTIETRLTNGKYPLPGKYPLRVVNVMQENDKTIMLVEPGEVNPGLILDRFLNLNENDFVIINDCLIEDENFLKGKSFVFTGTIDKRVELTNALTINYHGKICGPLTEKVDYLIVGNDPTKRRINRFVLIV
jgi:NAD-dependent DNA ligase